MSDTRRMIVTWEPAAGAPPQSSLARDIALGGLFIETIEPIAVGTLLSVEMSAGTKKVSLDARVFYVRAQPKGPNEPAGMAVRFLDLPIGTLSDLTAIVQHHRPPSHTVLGVGDEQEALWSSAGGRDEVDREEISLPSYITELEIPARESIEAQARLAAKRAPSIPPEVAAPSAPPSAAPPSSLAAAATSTPPPKPDDKKKEEPKRPRAQIAVLVVLILLALFGAFLARNAIISM